MKVERYIKVLLAVLLTLLVLVVVGSLVVFLCQEIPLLLYNYRSTSQFFF